MKTSFITALFTFLSVSYTGAQNLRVEAMHAVPEFTKSMIWDEAVLLAPDRDWWAGTFVDLNHDGRLDFLETEGAADVNEIFGALELVIYLQDASGKFVRKAAYNFGGTSYTWYIKPADFNEDGNVDILMDDAGNDLVLLLGKGDGTFREPKFLGSSAPILPIIADVNGDKHLDVLCGQYGSGTVVILAGNGDGSFRELPALPTAVRSQAAPNAGAGQIMAGDVNGDGKIDVVVASPQQDGPNWIGNLNVCLGKGDGTFRDPISTPGVACWRGVLGDFNGDGILDYAGCRYSSLLEVWLGNNDGHFVQKSSVALPTSPFHLTTTDLNGDGILDLVMSGESGSLGAARPMILLGRGDGTFLVTPSLIPFPGTLAANNIVQVIDYDGDSLPDIITGIMDPKIKKGVGMALALNTGFTPNASGGFLVSVEPALAQPLVFEKSTDLLSWNPWVTNSAPTAWRVLDTSTTGNSQGFYRARQQK